MTAHPVVLLVHSRWTLAVQTWVGLTLIPPIFPIYSANFVQLLSARAETERPSNRQNQSQPNPGRRGDGSPCNAFRIFHLMLDNVTSVQWVLYSRCTLQTRRLKRPVSPRAPLTLCAWATCSPRRPSTQPTSPGICAPKFQANLSTVGNSNSQIS